MLPAELERAIRKRVEAIPIFNTLKMEILRLAPGECDVRVPRKIEYDGVFDSFHGGLLMTVADSTACFAILTQVGATARLTTTDMNIRFLAPCLTALTAKARVIKLGRALCPVAVDLYNAENRKVAVAQVAYFLLDGSAGGG